MSVLLSKLLVTDVSYPGVIYYNLGTVNLYPLSVLTVRGKISCFFFESFEQVL